MLNLKGVDVVTIVGGCIQFVSTSFLGGKSRTHFKEYSSYGLEPPTRLPWGFPKVVRKKFLFHAC